MHKPKQFSRSLLKELLPEHAIIVEAGAHIGRDTLKLAKLFPQGSIYAFEPNPTAFAQLTSATSDIKNITCFQYALSNIDGTSSMYVCENISALSSLHEPATVLHDHKDASFTQITVKTIKLDTWAQEQAIKNVDFIWLDTQGHELAVLQGAQNILKTTQFLLVEMNLEKRYAQQPLFDEVAAWLRNQNFEILEEYFHHTTWGNVLFERKKKIQ